jgi:hypothetical protein
MEWGRTDSIARELSGPSVIICWLFVSMCEFRPNPCDGRVALATLMSMNCVIFP